MRRQLKCVLSTRLWRWRGAGRSLETADGRVVRSASGVESGDIVTTQLVDGILTSTITARTQQTNTEHNTKSGTSEEAT